MHTEKCRVLQRCMQRNQYRWQTDRTEGSGEQRRRENGFFYFIWALHLRVDMYTHFGHGWCVVRAELSFEEWYQKRSARDCGGREPQNVRCLRTIFMSSDVCHCIVFVCDHHFHRFVSRFIIHGAVGRSARRIKTQNYVSVRAYKFPPFFGRW